MPRRSGYGPAVSSGVTAHAAFAPVPPPFADDDDVVVVSGDVVDPPQPIAATMLLRPSLASASRLFITSPCPHHTHQHNCHIHALDDCVEQETYHRETRGDRRMRT